MVPLSHDPQGSRSATVLSVSEITGAGNVIVLNPPYVTVDRFPNTSMPILMITRIGIELGASHQQGGSRQHTRHR